MASKNSNAGASAVLLHQVGSNVEHVTIENFGSNVVYISNNAAVTTTTGFPLTAKSKITWYSAVGSVYGICATGTSRVQVTANVG